MPEKRISGAEKKKIMAKAMKAKVRNLEFSRGKISLSFMGHKISDRISLKKENLVADWSRIHRKIYIDREFGEREMKKSFRALAVHEAVEKFLAEKFHLDVDTEAHPVAAQKEKECLKREGGNWRSHEMIVYWDWHRQGEH